MAEQKQLGLVNIGAQANAEFNNTNAVSLKTGPIALMRAWFGNKTLNYIADYEQSKMEVERQLKQKVDAIDPKKRKEPDMNIVGPTMSGLEYNLGVPEIRRMYINLISANCNKTLSDQISPAFSGIISQLSPEDAIFLESLRKIGRRNFPVLYVKYRLCSNQAVFREFKKILVVRQKNSIWQKELSGVIIDNLGRLGLIRMDTQSYLQSEQQFMEQQFKQIKSGYQEKTEDDFEIFYEPSTLEFTDLGWNFIRICCSED